jgi:hypothetical protein
MTTHFSFKPGCTTHPFHGGAGDEYIIETPEARRFKISGTALRLLEQLDRGTSLEEVCAGPTYLNCEQLRTFILENYGGFLLAGSGESFDRHPLASPARSLLLGRTIIPRSTAISLSSYLHWLYSPVVAAVLLLGIIASHAAFYFTPAFAPASVTGAHASIVVVLSIASVLAHELGHASALSRYGGSPNGVGFGLYILLPVFYADVSQAWKLKQWQRVIVDMGGVYFQQVFFIFGAILSWLANDPSLRAVCLAIDVMTLLALNPALRFDGYWVITDWLGLANLQGATIVYLRSLTAWLRRRGGYDYPRHLVGIKAIVFFGYALLSNGFMLGLVVLNLRWLRSTILALTTGLPDLGLALWRAVAAGQWVHSADLLIACLFLVASCTTLLIGIYYRAKAGLQMLERKFAPTQSITNSF